MPTTLDSGPDFSSALSFIFFVVIIIGAVFVIKTISSAAGRGVQRRQPQPLDATPFEAGAIGTMAGYELGREEMEREQREQIQQQMFNNMPPPTSNFPGNDIGGGASGNFGGGIGGGNIGGGSSGNF